MYARRTIFIIVSLIIMAWSIAVVQEDTGKLEVCVYGVTSDVVRELRENGTLRVTSLPSKSTQAYITHSNTLKRSKELNTIILGYSPVVAITKNKEFAQRYNINSSELSFQTGTISLLNLVVNQPVKLYIPDKFSEYRKVVIDTLLNEIYDGTEESLKLVNGIIANSVQERDIKSLLKESSGIEQNTPEIILAPECVMSAGSYALGLKSPAQTILYLSTVDSFDTCKTVGRILGERPYTFSKPTLLKETQYRKSKDLKCLVDCPDISDIHSLNIKQDYELPTHYSNNYDELFGSKYYLNDYLKHVTK